jgi:hypothetical protein
MEGVSLPVMSLPVMSLPVMSLPVMSLLVRVCLCLWPPMEGVSLPVIVSYIKRHEQ